MHWRAISDCFGDLHKHLTGVIKPGNLVHLGAKLIQLAATNSTDGTHTNTRVSRLEYSSRFSCAPPQGFIKRPL